MKKIFFYFLFFILFLSLNIDALELSKQTVSQNENPDISSIIDVFGYYNNVDTSQNKIYFRFASLMIKQKLTPWTAGTVILVKPGASEGIEAEEVYALFYNLPFSILAKVGKFHTDFGYINKLHKHQLPTFNHPNALYYMFNSVPGTHALNGDEPNADMGMEISTLLPFDFYSELELGTLDGNNDTILSSGSDYLNTYLVRLKNYWDLSYNMGLNFWLSAMKGKNSNFNADTYLGNCYLGLKIKSRTLPEFQYLKFDSEFYYRTIQSKTQVYDTLLGYYARLLYSFRAAYQHKIGIQYSSVIPDDLKKTSINSVVDTFVTTKIFRNTEFRLDWNADITDTKKINHTITLEVTLTLGPHRHLL